MAEIDKESAERPEKAMKKPDLTPDVQTPKAQVAKAQAHDAQAADAQATDAQAPDEQAADAQAHDAQAADAQAHDLQAPDAQAAKAQTPDEQAADAQAHDVQAPDAQAAKAQAPDEQAADARAADAQAPDAPPHKARAAEATKKEKFDAQALEGLDEEALYNTALKLSKQTPTSFVNKSIERISVILNKRFSEDCEEKLMVFEAMGGDSDDFEYQNPWEKRFKELATAYREKKAAFNKQKDRELNQNLLVREQLTEALRKLYQEPEDMHATFEKFKDIQQRWKQAGGIPHQHADRIFKTYYHHLENFYNYLNLNKAQRERDFKNNLAEKEKIIARAEALIDEPDIYKACNELQHLHMVWKEEIGPVDKENREAIWSRFKEVSAKIHERRQAYFQQRHERQRKSLETKEAVMVEIRALTKSQPDSHAAWQAAMKTLQGLRRIFMDAGAVPQADRQRIQEAFRKTCRSFTKKKDEFYNDIRKGQQKNLKAKIALIESAAENREREDWDEAAHFFKKLQGEWKEIGHVPKRRVNDVWELFKSHCNYFFERYHNRNKPSEAEAKALMAQREKLIETLQSVALPEDPTSALNELETLEAAWHKTDALPGKTALDETFQQLLDAQYDKLGLDEATIALHKYRCTAAALSRDETKLLEEVGFVKHKINELEKRLQQLENNLACFSGDTAESPLLKQAEKNTEGIKEKLERWRGKLEVLRRLSAPEKNG